MAQPLVVEQSRAIPVGQEAAFSGTVPIPLPTLFHRWYGPIPPIKEVRDQTGDWDAVGQTRTVVLTGGGSMREQLTSYDVAEFVRLHAVRRQGPARAARRPRRGPVGVRARRHRHQGDVALDDSPESSLAAPILPVFGKLWLGYARQSLEVSDQLVG